MTRPQAAINRFFLDSEYSVYYRKAQPFEWQNQVTANFGLLSILSGDLDCVVSDRKIKVDSSHSIVIEPNQNVTARSKQVEFLYLTLAAAFIVEHALAMRLVAPKSMVKFHGHLIDDDALNALAGSFATELIDEEPGKKFVIRALVEQVVVHLLRRHATTRRSDELELSRVGLVDRRIRRSVELMHAQLDQDLSLKSLAAASYLSPFHFSRLFKKLTGVTPHNYLAAVRATRAQSLLATTDMSITEVGTRVGYLSASHFTKAFRSSTGTTPREFRKALIPR
ncbi:MAG TPA: helix-turn-helix domain-containing protein [Pyrinomonadaceae bacterium]|jgi:AraC family transcriptional regulator